MTSEDKRILNFMASSPFGTTTAEHQDTHDILLETGGTLMARGHLYNIIARNIGAGVYHLHLELANL